MKLMNPKTKTILLILLSFALGAAGGIMINKYYFGPRPPHRPDFNEVRREFVQKLMLDTVQVAEVDSLMDSHRKKMDDIRKLFSAERDTLRSDIRKHLRGEQNKLYDEYIKEAESRDARRREGDKQQSK